MNSADTLFTSLQTGFAAIGALIVSYSLSTLGAVILLVVGYLAARLIHRWIFEGLGHIHGFDQTLRHFFANVARYMVLGLFLVMVLGQFGVQTTSIIAAIGAIGLAIGLALQGTLQNIAAGIMLLVLRPFRIGEDVEVGQVKGNVEEIGLFATSLRTVDGVYVLAPNSTLWNQPVRNFTRNGVRRNDIAIGIGYEDDIDLALKTLTDLAANDARVLQQPAAPRAFVEALGASTVDVVLRYWTSDTNYLSARTDLTRAAKLAFDRAHISMPAPQQEITFRNAGAEVPAPLRPQ